MEAVNYVQTTHERRIENQTLLCWSLVHDYVFDWDGRKHVQEENNGTEKYPFLFRIGFPSPTSGDELSMDLFVVNVLLIQD